MSRVTDHAVLGHRGMLISKRPAILCMAAKAKLIGARRAQVVTAHAAVRIVTVGATHLALAQRVMIGQAHFPTLGLMTLQTSVIGLPLRLNKRLRFRYEIFYRRDVA